MDKFDKVLGIEMDKFDETLKKTLESQGQLDPEKSSAMQQEVVQFLDKKLRKAKRDTLFFLFLGIAIMNAALFAFLRSSSTKSLVLYAMFFIIFYEAMVMMRLWYTTINTKISMLKEMKQLQLQIAELSSRDSEKT